MDAGRVEGGGGEGRAAGQPVATAPGPGGPAADVFVSYKREDEARVAPLVAALESAGLRVWWDREIAGGAGWRDEIAGHLASARCVVVTWTAASTGPDGAFVRDEAGRALRRGVLLPVRLDPVEPPVGFGEVQALDLAGWRGRTGDPRVDDVVRAARAIAAGERPPRPTGGRRRRTRIAWGTAGGAVAACVLALALDLGGLQRAACRVPGVRDLCGGLGLGGVPSAAEQAAWDAAAAREDGEGLRGYLASFPSGAFVEAAKTRLAACRTVADEAWVPATRRVPLYVPAGAEPSRDDDAAKADARARGLAAARDACAGYGAGSFRLLGATIDEDGARWQCHPRGAGRACALDGVAVCAVEQRTATPRETCR